MPVHAVFNQDVCGYTDCNADEKTNSKAIVTVSPMGNGGMCMHLDGRITTLRSHARSVRNANSRARRHQQQQRRSTIGRYFRQIKNPINPKLQASAFVQRTIGSRSNFFSVSRANDHWALFG